MVANKVSYIYVPSTTSTRIYVHMLTYIHSHTLLHASIYGHITRMTFVQFALIQQIIIFTAFFAYASGEEWMALLLLIKLGRIMELKATRL